MPGVYTDNQPDFSFLGPGETRTWSQFWYPIQKIGPAQFANLEAALSLNLPEGAAKASIGMLQPEQKQIFCRCFSRKGVRGGR